VTVADFRRARSPQQQEQRRRDILDVARQMLDRAPLAEISLRELSRQVGLAKSNVVRYFPTREAVFLALLVDDWARWLDTLPSRFPRRDARRRGDSTYARVASVIADTLGEQPRLCDLIANSQLILERNIPVETARAFKSAAFTHTARLAQLVASAVPELDDAQAYEFAGVTWALIVGAWPIAHPSPTVAQVLAEPEFAGMCVDFVPAMTRTLTVLLRGLTSERGNAGA
jgi:AcrR family transcriptional regulator